MKLVKGLIVAAGAVVLAVSVAGYSSAEETKQVYADRCAQCHGATGKGDGPAGVLLSPPPPSFAASLKGKSDDWIAKIIKGGGEAVGQAATMPAGGDFSEQQIKDLVKYVKSLGA